jgi:glycosyltransferase involved in cell wall biosynthesis
MAQPLVTIVLTVFRRTTYLNEAIKSALGQTCGDLEVIVTDDSDSESICNTCAVFQHDSRLRYRANRSVLGAPLNIRAALQEAAGDYVVILNDDDVMEPFMVETLLPPLTSDKDCVVSFGDHWIIGADGNVSVTETERNTRRWGRDHIPSGKIQNAFGLALRGGIPFVMGTVFRRSACYEKWFIREVAGAYDSWLALQLALDGGAFYFNPARVFRYRVHSASESARLAAEKASAQVFIFAQLAHDSRTRKERGFIRRTLSHFLFVLGRDRLYFGSPSSARRAFLSSLRYAVSVRALTGTALTFIPIWMQRPILRSWRSARRIREDLPSSD